MTTIIVSIVVAVVSLGIGLLLGRKQADRIIQAFIREQEAAERDARSILEKAEREAGEKKKEAEKYLREAQRKAEEITKKAEKEAREIIYAERRRLESEIYRERRELDRERRKLEELQIALEKKSEQLDRRESILKNKERELNERERAISIKERAVEEKLEEITKKLEEIAGMTRQEARAELMKSVEIQARYEAAQLAHKIREEAKEKAEREAKEIIAQAIQRCASEQTAEITTTVVELPSDDVKGRIIGREGRNIRAFEQATGVEVIIDDTPEVIVLSSFDPIRREKARLAMEELIRDGRIHPARIEEVVQKIDESFDQHIRKIGEEAILKLGLSGFHPDMIYYIGKMNFRTSYGQNLLEHSIETAKLAAIMASELGLNPDIAKRAALLHDIGKVMEEEGPHALLGAQLAKRLGENDIVVNAIASHHGDVEPMSPYAPIVAAADAISGSRPGARRESLEAYIRRIQKLEEIAYEHKGVEKAFAIQAGREIRVIVDARKVSDAEAHEIAKNISRRIEEEMQYPGQIKVIVIREVRAVEYAR